MILEGMFKDFRPLNIKIMMVAAEEIGVKETPGPRATGRVIDYFNATNLQDGIDSDEVPWCSAFANWVVIQCGVLGTGKLNARSWEKWEQGRETKIPRMGDIVVLKRRNSSWKGHVGFLSSPYTPGDTIDMVGGNQGNRVCDRAYDVSEKGNYELCCFMTVNYTLRGTDEGLKITIE